ncbi:DPP IV N-terminal domain-containing protein [Bradyrhizobium barranii subsp. apii]|uniref:DPP IV N-terminal domain-containing protein n=1 Tax=Bradyrhizobium barranii TaxID=2992140 RepID=UPI001CD35F3C|nr:DPP IV N-terminal domain-containing protein [Bradyrhizobium barranii]UPT97337.1 DPP IV N-terminal domain-containing protein [Bradyrhizobium barranii subsp. apii]
MELRSCQRCLHRCCNATGRQPAEPYDDTPLAENDPDRTSASPDGKWLAYIRNYNLYLRSQDGLQDIQLTWDGSQADYYALFTLSWSPASTHLAAYRVRPGLQREVHYLESSPADQLEPKHSTMTYPKPGDAITLLQPVLFDVASRRAIAIDNAAFQNPYSLSAVQWWKDGRGFTFEFNQRGHQLYRLIEVDAATGQVRSLIDEVSKTFVDFQPLVMDQVNTGKTFRYDIDDGKEIIWASERDGNEHLDLFNGRTGELQNQITRGDWVVRAVYHIDPIKHQI